MRKSRGRLRSPRRVTSATALRRCLITRLRSRRNARAFVARNVEIKARLTDLSALAQRVATFATEGPTLIHQDDAFFTCAEGRLKLRTFSSTAGELIFYRRADQSGPKESFFVRSPTQSPQTLREALTLAYGLTGRVIK